MKDKRKFQGTHLKTKVIDIFVSLTGKDENKDEKNVGFSIFLKMKPTKGDSCIKERKLLKLYNH